METSIQPLAESLPLLRFEPATSHASRLAAMNGAGNARQFCWDHYLRFERIASGDPKEIARYGFFAGADTRELLKWTPKRLGANTFSINGEVLTAFRLRHLRLRVCPGCIEDDKAAVPDLRADAAVACRVFTLVDAIRTCAIHNLSLVQVADKASFGDHDKDYSIAIGEALDDGEDLRALSVEREPTAFEAYLLGRLGVLERREVSLLDLMDISQVTTVCERLGVFDLHGRRAQISELDESGALASAQRGFEWCERGDAGIRDFVTMAQQRAAGDGATGMSNAILGRFHYFLNSETNRSNFTVLKQLIVDRLSELLPYGPDDAPIFGVLPARRHWHTLVSAERQYGLPYRTIKKRVERAGIHTRLNLAFDKTRFAIGVEELHAVLTSPEGTMSRAEVIEQTGAHAHDFMAFEAAGILKPVSGGSNASQSMFRRGDVEDLERSLLANAVELAGEAPNWATVHQAYLATSWSRSEVFEHIARGTVPSRSVNGQKSVASLRVDLDALRQIHPLFGREVMTMGEAAAHLGVSETVVNRLVEYELIEAHSARNAETGKLKTALCKDVVLGFQRTYIPISEIWRHRGGRMAKINPMLETHGLTPSFPPGKLRCTFYSRAEVDGIFRPPE